MEKYIEFIKVHLPDIMAFALIATTYITQLINKLQSTKSNLLAKTFFTERTKKVDDTYLKMQQTAQSLKDEFKSLQQENELLKSQLSQLKQAIQALCNTQNNLDE